MKNYFLIILSLLSVKLMFSQKIEIVFCADFSGSTNGLVVELQKTIWATINQLETNHSSTQFSFGLVGYGRQSFGKDNYYSRVIHPLGSDVNDIGYSLVKLQVIINSCEAYPHKALNNCVNDIKWSKEKEVKKILLFIGNGDVPLKEMEKEFKKSNKIGIILKPIFYQPLAKLANGKRSWGKFAKLTGNDLIVASPLPTKIVFKKYYDDEFILKSGMKLISTYLPYGLEGKRCLKQLEKMFKKLKDTSLDNFEEMIVYQSSIRVQGKYKWDLVDRLMVGELIIKNLIRTDLPFFLQGLTEQQLLNYVSIKLKERKIIVAKLRLELNKRNEYVYRKQEKSKFMSGKGGLNNIISIILKKELQKYK